MKIFYSGGSAIAECFARDPNIMLSYFVVVKDGQPDGRCRRVLNNRSRELAGREVAPGKVRAAKRSGVILTKCGKVKGERKRG